MGIYYKWVCPDRNEHLDPEWFNESDKRPAADATTLRVLTLLCQWGTWKDHAVQLACDTSDYYYSPDCSCEDGHEWSDGARAEAERLMREFPKG